MKDKGCKVQSEVEWKRSGRGVEEEWKRSEE